MKRQIKRRIKTTKERTESNSQNGTKDQEAKKVRKSAEEGEIKQCRKLRKA
jgi:hypothetical protein